MKLIMNSARQQTAALAAVLLLMSAGTAPASDRVPTQSAPQAPPQAMATATDMLGLNGPARTPVDDGAVKPQVTGESDAHLDGVWIGLALLSAIVWLGARRRIAR